MRRWQETNFRDISALPFLPRVDTQDVLRFDGSIIRPDVFFHEIFGRLNRVQSQEYSVLVEIEKDEINESIVGYIRWLRGDDARKLGDKSHWDVGRVIAVSWLLCAAFL